MNVVSMNDGAKAPWSLSGSELRLGSPAQVSLDLADLEADNEVVVTVYAAPDGELTLEGGAYAAVITIPPRRYEPQTVTEDGMDGPMEVVKPVAVPLNVDAVTLKLWAMPEPKPAEEA